MATSNEKLQKNPMFFDRGEVVWSDVNLAIIFIEGWLRGALFYHIEKIDPIKLRGGAHCFRAEKRNKHARDLTLRKAHDFGRSSKRIVSFVFLLFYLSTTYNTKQLQVLLTIRQFTSPTLQSNVITYSTYNPIYTLLTKIIQYLHPYCNNEQQNNDNFIKK